MRGQSESGPEADDGDKHDREGRGQQQEVERLKVRLAKLEEAQKKKRASAKPTAAPQTPADQGANPNVPPASAKP